MHIHRAGSLALVRIGPARTVPWGLESLRAFQISYTLAPGLQ